MVLRVTWASEAFAVNRLVESESRQLAVKLHRSTSAERDVTDLPVMTSDPFQGHTI